MQNFTKSFKSLYESVSLWAIDKLFVKSNGIVYVKEVCLGASDIVEKNIAGSRVFALYDNEQIKTMTVNGKFVDSMYKFKSGDQVQVAVRPNGSFGRLLVTAAIGAALYFSAGLASGSVATFLKAAGTGLIASSAVSAIASLFINQRGTTGDIERAEQRAEIKGSSNRQSRSVMPILFGEHLQTPFYGQQPYRLAGEGSATNVYRQFFASNYKDVNMSDRKLGETLISDFNSSYINVTESSGGSSYIGFPSVKVSQRDEQLSADTTTSVNEIAQLPISGVPFVAPFTFSTVFEFTNVELGEFSDKQFSYSISGSGGSASGSLSVTESDLVLVSGTTYTATISDNPTFSAPVTGVTYTSITPVTSTRNNISEIDNGLNVTVEDFVYDMGGTIYTKPVNQPVNKYFGDVTDVVETSPKNTKEVDFIFSFPSGLFKATTSGGRSARAVKVDILFKEVSAPTYSQISDATIYYRDLNGNKQPLSNTTTTVSGATVTMQSPSDLNGADELFFRNIGIEFPSDGQYTVRVRSADLFEKDNLDVGYPQIADFNFYVNDDAMDFSILEDLNQVAVEATAYKSLSGELRQYNYIGKLECPVWNGSNWNTKAETRNPAAVIRYILTDPMANPRAEPISSIDNDSLVDFYDWCEENNYYADGVITEPVKVGAIISEILDNCKASFALIQGKYVFVIDDDSKYPVDLFTQHNSWGFNWTPAVGRTTDAIRLQYINEEDYTQSEVSLYWYNNTVNLVPEAGKIDTDYEMTVREVRYITNKDHLVDRFTYGLERSQLKRNTFEFNVNLEALSLKLFDRICVANTCDMTDESSGLIKEVISSGGNITGFKLYSAIDIASGSSIVLRSIGTSEFVVNTYPVLNSGLTDEVSISPIQDTGEIRGAGQISGFTNGYEWHYDGDHFDIGVGSVYTCSIEEIRYNEDFTATITAREA